MGKKRKKDVKAQRTKKARTKGAPVSDLPVKNATGVKGGRKYLVVTMDQPLITS